MAGDDDDLIARRYRRIRHIGSGGMGVVWQAKDEVLGRTVALKELSATAGLSPNGTGPDGAARRAMREARIAARLHHPNVIAVYDVVQHDGRPWLVMEYLASRSLADVISESGALPVEEVARIGALLASALTAAHEAGIVHRDLKPANVLISDSGTVKLTDFGISRATGDTTVTGTGVVLGTVSYIAPEMAQGKTADTRSDVYSLGATLYSAVEGQPPFGFDDNAIALLYRIAHEEIIPARRAGSLDSVLMWMLERDPERRPTTRQVTRMLEDIGISSRAGSAGPAVEVESVAPLVRQALLAPTPEAVPAAPAAEVTPVAPVAEEVEAAEAAEAAAAEAVEEVEPAAPAETPEPTPTWTTEKLPREPSGNADYEVAGGPADPVGPGVSPASSSAFDASDTSDSGRRRAIIVGIGATLVLIAITVLLVQNTGGNNAAATGSPSASASRSSSPAPVQSSAAARSASATPAHSGSAPAVPISSATTAGSTSQDVASQLTATIVDYYQLMPGNTGEGWTWMTADYQQNHAKGRSNYDAFWADVQSVSISDVVATPPSTVVATIHYVYTNGTTAVERTSFGLVQVQGRWEIASSSVLSHQSG